MEFVFLVYVFTLKLGMCCGFIEVCERTSVGC